MARPGPFALPAEKKWPIGDKKHANLAITFLYMKKIDDETRRKVAAAIRKRWKSDPEIMARLKKMEEKKIKKTGAKKMAKKKKKSTTKGRRRKGQPRGARLAYDALKKKRKKKKTSAKRKTTKKKTTKRKVTAKRRKRSPAKKTGILAMLTSALPA